MIQFVTYNLWLGVLLVSFVAASGCFITNCPPGGKRSEKTALTVRQCERCGPPGMMGRCFGPQICCSPEFGCFFSTAETFVCQLENRFPTPCHNPGSSCSGNGDTGLINGQCGTDGICCSSETCTLDDNCRDEASSPLSLPSFIPAAHSKDPSSPFTSSGEDSAKASSSLNGGGGRGRSHSNIIGKHYIHHPVAATSGLFDSNPSLLQQLPSPLQMAFHKLIQSSKNAPSVHLPVSETGSTNNNNNYIPNGNNDY